MGVMWHLIVVFICTLRWWIILNICHILPIHLDIIFRKFSTQALCPFFVWLLNFLLLNCKCSLCILNINPLSDTWFATILSYFIGCLFTLLIVSLVNKKALNLINTHFGACVLTLSLIILSNKILRITNNPIILKYTNQNVKIVKNACMHVCKLIHKVVLMAGRII